MSDVIFFACLGLASGALFAMLAPGLVISYKASGVINFAYGAIAVYPAYTMTELKQYGRLQLPVVDFLPTRFLNVPVEISLHDGPLPFWVCLAVSLAMAALLGVMSHYLVFRPLRNAPPLGKVVGSLGVLLYLQGVTLVNFGTAARQPDAVVPMEAIDGFLWFNRPLPSVHLWLSLIAICVGVVLWLLYRYSRFGLATRAAAGNEKGAVLLGYSPERLALVNWVLSAIVAGLAGILVSPVTSLDPARFTLFIVPALGAALIGNLTSLPLAVAGGFGLGAMQGIVQQWSIRPWFPAWARTGAVTAVPLLAIVAVLIARGARLPLRGSLVERRLPQSPCPRRVWRHALIWPAVVLLLSSGLRVGGVTLLPDLTGQWQLGLTLSMILAILALSYVVVTGFVGQVSLVQLSLAGTAAFVMVRLLSDGERVEGAASSVVVSGPGLPMYVAAPVAIAVAALTGVLAGIPALRIRGMQLAVATIAFALALQEFYFKNPQLTDLRSGAGAPVPAPRLFGLDLSVVSDSGLSDSFRFTAFVVVVLALAAVGVANLRRGGIGRRMLSVRANERAAAAAGIDVVRTKLFAFAFASALAGVAGVLLAFQQQTISFQNFDVLLGLSILAFAYVGGITSISGAIVAGLLSSGGLAFVFIRYHAGDVSQYVGIIGGVGLVVTAIAQPAGVAPFFQGPLRRVGQFVVSARRRDWARVVIGVAPALCVGAALGWALWTRHADYTWWMTVLGAALGVAARAGVVHVRELRRSALELTERSRVLTQLSLRAKIHNTSLDT